MIEKWIGKTGMLLAAAVLMLCTAVMLSRAASTFAGMVEAAKVEARAERDAHWKAEIARSNAQVATARAEAAERVINIQAEASDRIARAEQDAEDAKLQSEALPNGSDLGLDAARVRLLPD